MITARFPTLLAAVCFMMAAAAQVAPAAFAKHTADEVDRWRKVTAEAKIQLN